MPLNSRDLWLVLKAQDQTNRALNTFARNVRNAGNTVAMAQLQAQRAAVLGAIAQARLASEVERAAIGQDTARRSAFQHTIALRNNEIATRRAEIAQLSAQRTLLNQTAAYAKANGATDAQVDAIKRVASGMNNEITRRKYLIGQIQAEVAAQQKNVNSIQGSINARKQQIVNNDSYIARQKQVISSIDQEIDRLEAHNRSMQESERHMARMGQNLQMISQTATAMGFAMTAAGVAAVIGISDAIKVAVEYERQVRSTATQISNFGGNLDELADIGRRLAKEIAVPFEEIQPALFDIFSSMDVNIPEAEKLLREFAKAAVAGGTDMQAVSRATIGLLNAFQRPVSDVNHLLDLQFKLVQLGIGTYEEWNQRIGLVTPSAVRAGQSIEVMVAALATSTRMGISAARSGTAVARAFDALSHPTTVKNLKALGVNVQDATGKFRPFNEVLGDFRAALMKLPEKDRLAKILEVFKGAGGTIEARRFLQNMLLGAGNLEMFDKILDQTQDSAGAMDKAYTLMADSAASKTQLLKNQWMLLKESLGRSLQPAFAAFVGWLAKIIGKFNELSPHSQRIIAMFVALGAVFSTVAGVGLLIIGVVAAIAAAITVAGTAIAIVVGVLMGLIAVLGLGVAAFALLWEKCDNFRIIIQNMWSDVKDIWDILVSFSQSVADNFETYVMPPLKELWSYIQDNILPAFRTFRDEVADKVIAALQEIGDKMEQYVKPAIENFGKAIHEKIIPAVQYLTEVWIAHRDQIMLVVGAVVTLVEWLVILGGWVSAVIASNIGQAAIKALLLLIGTLAVVISIVSTTISIFGWLGQAVSDIIGWFNRMRNIVDTTIGQVISIMSSLPGRIQAAVGNLGSLLLSAGRAVIQSLIDGMQAKFGDLAAKAAQVAGIIAAVVPGSPVKKGPLRVLNNGYAGGQIVNMLADGMNSRMNALQNSSSSMGSSVYNSLGAGLAQNPSTFGGERVVNQTINVYTQEIDPRKTSAELGFELVKVL